MTLSLTLTDPHDAFESFCAPVFCDYTELFGVRTRTSSHFEEYMTLKTLLMQLYVHELSSGACECFDNESVLKLSMRLGDQCS